MNIMNGVNLLFKKITLVSLVIFGITSIQTLEFEVNAFVQEDNYLEMIDQNFEDDTVLVVLDEDATKDTQSYTASDFKDINIKSIEDMTESLKNKKNGREAKFNEHVDFNRILKIKLEKADKKAVLKAVFDLESMNGVIAASPNYQGEYLDTVPNDTFESNQWALDSINLYDAWDITTGNSTVSIGVVDSGIQNTHADLDGHINDILSEDFSGSNFPWYVTEGHATHVAGIIGAESNNNQGIAGVNWNAQLISLKVGDAAPTTAAVTDAIIYAETEGIDVLNLSLSVVESTVMNQAINGYDGLLVIAAGNNFSSTVNYPANFDASNIISVGSIDSDDDKSDFSNWGVDVDIYAPGGSIYSTYPNGYTYSSGTSMATPYVVGVASLILSVDPTLSAEEVIDILLDSASHITINNNDSSTDIVDKLDAYQAVSDASHTHSYTMRYRWASLYQHRAYCTCGDFVLRPHVVSSNWNGVGYTTCLLCGGDAAMGIVMMGVTSMVEDVQLRLTRDVYFGQNSFVLDDGTIVLSDKDLELFEENPEAFMAMYDVFDHDECCHHDHLDV